MISRIQGILAEKQASGLLVDVQGIGYEVLVSLNTFFDLPELGEKVALFTHFVVREDAQQLYGFVNAHERELFRTLIKISGVGPRMALAILSGMTVSDFVRCVQGNDTAALVRLPGVGKKTAERLLVEMRDRLQGWEMPSGVTSPGSAANLRQSSLLQEAESALVALGYKPQEAARMLNAAMPQGHEPASSEELIRMALRTIAGK